MTFIATAPHYSAVIPAAMSKDDARRIASEDSGRMPWEIKIERMKG